MNSSAVEQQGPMQLGPVSPQPLLADAAAQHHAGSSSPIPIPDMQQAAAAQVSCQAVRAGTRENTCACYRLRPSNCTFVRLGMAAATTCILLARRQRVGTSQLPAAAAEGRAGSAVAHHQRGHSASLVACRASAWCTLICIISSVSCLTAVHGAYLVARAVKQGLHAPASALLTVLCHLTHLAQCSGPQTCYYFAGACGCGSRSLY